MSQNLENILLFLWTKRLVSFCASSSVRAKYCVYSKDNKRLSVNTKLATQVNKQFGERKIKQPSTQNCLKLTFLGTSTHLSVKLYLTEINMFPVFQENTNENNFSMCRWKTTRYHEGLRCFLCCSQHILHITSEAEQMPGKTVFFHPSPDFWTQTPRSLWPD